MALINIPTDHIKLRKSISFEKKPLMLKDYLIRDDLSSCSSSSFKSFPRRQCCTTVRFLLEADLKKSKGYSSATKRLLKRSRSKPVSKTFAALKKASEAVLNAVKLLPFASAKSSSPLLQSKSSRKGLLSKSFSRKLFRRSFWRKSEKEDDDEIKRWKSFREFLEEKNQPSDQNSITDVNTTDSSSTIITTSSVSTSSNSNSNSNSHSWAESEFTSDVLQSSSGNSEISYLNDVVESKTNSLEKENVSNLVGVTAGHDSISYSKDWQKEEEKEQFSPVSVLDCHFDDEEDNSSPNVLDQAARVEGTKQKIRRFENLPKLKPVDLEKRIALSELQHESLCKFSEDDQKLNSETKLLKLLKAKIPTESLNFMPDNLLLDFFMEEDTGELHVNMQELLNVAEDWINGSPRELVMGWEFEEGRKAYLKEMERNQNWRSFDEEKEEVGMQVELEVFSLLVDEILTDLF